MCCCLSQVTVSSGGMLTQKLNVDDLQFEKGTFDGTMAYAQNKVKQIYNSHVLRLCLEMTVVLPCCVEVFSSCGLNRDSR